MAIWDHELELSRTNNRVTDVRLNETIITPTIPIIDTNVVVEQANFYLLVLLDFDVW